MDQSQTLLDWGLVRHTLNGTEYKTSDTNTQSHMYKYTLCRHTHEEMFLLVSHLRKTIAFSVKGRKSMAPLIIKLLCFVVGL